MPYGDISYGTWWKLAHPTGMGAVGPYVIDDTTKLGYALINDFVLAANNIGLSYIGPYGYATGDDLLTQTVVIPNIRTDLLAQYPQPSMLGDSATGGPYDPEEFLVFLQNYLVGNGFTTPIQIAGVANNLLKQGGSFPSDWNTWPGWITANNTGTPPQIKNTLLDPYASNSASLPVSYSSTAAPVAVPILVVANGAPSVNSVNSGQNSISSYQSAASDGSPQSAASSTSNLTVTSSPVTSAPDSAPVVAATANNNGLLIAGGLLAAFILLRK